MNNMYQSEGEQPEVLTDEEIKLHEFVYVDNDHFQRTERDTDEYWSCYIPDVIYRRWGIIPERNKAYYIYFSDVKGMLTRDTRTKINWEKLSGNAHGGIK